jgi:hypothetical protein
VKFWDTSAIVPLVVGQAMTPQLKALLERDPKLFVWWGSEVECASALARLERERFLDASTGTKAAKRLRDLFEGWEEIAPCEAVREIAKRFVRVHPLRAADALQLSAAFVAASGRPSSLEFVTLDDRLAAAARKEGFLVVGIP